MFKTIREAFIKELPELTDEETKELMDSRKDIEKMLNDYAIGEVPERYRIKFRKLSQLLTITKQDWYYKNSYYVPSISFENGQGMVKLKLMLLSKSRNYVFEVQLGSINTKSDLEIPSELTKKLYTKIQRVRITVEDIAEDKSSDNWFFTFKMLLQNTGTSHEFLSKESFMKYLDYIEEYVK